MKKEKNKIQIVLASGKKLNLSEEEYLELKNILAPYQLQPVYIPTNVPTIIYPTPWNPQIPWCTNNTSVFDVSST